MTWRLSRLRARAALPVAGAAAALALAAAAAQPAAAAVTPIGPDQYFVGAVNTPDNTGSSNTLDKILVNCRAGLLTGYPAAGQHAEVHASNGVTTGPPETLGYTGTASSVEATLAPGAVEGAPAAGYDLGTLKAYDTALPIPTDILLPCSGTGTVTFDPGDTSGKGKASVIPVTFTSVATTG